MGKHTPGPWHFHMARNDGAVRTFWVNAEYEIPAGKRQHAVCELYDVFHQGEHQADAEANARLIAAAPELLRSCREALASSELWMDWDNVGGEHEGEAEACASVVQRLKAAIAKATGESD